MSAHCRSGCGPASCRATAPSRTAPCWKPPTPSTSGTHGFAALEAEAVRVALSGYRDSDLASLATTVSARIEALEDQLAEAVKLLRDTGWLIKVGAFLDAYDAATDPQPSAE